MSDDRQSWWLTREDRGALWIPRAILAAGIIIGAVFLVASGEITQRSSQAEELEQEKLSRQAEDIITILDATNRLATEGGSPGFVLYWNAREIRFINSHIDDPGDDYYTTLENSPNNPLRPVLQKTLGPEAVGVNIHVRYQTGDGTLNRTRVLYQGPPGQNAVRESRNILLSDDVTPTLGGTSSDGDACTLGEMGGSTGTGTNGCTDKAFYAPDASPNSSVYNAIRVQITIWET
ncbi:hypothetical protein RYH80_18675 [Halobaculum sp. MBLA0147]|uniref:DUF7288 family protein n=1 Tax=Halobaculum sp. MBLA0147 TaxID=3079934 RepID=UPI0035263755